MVQVYAVYADNNPATAIAFFRDETEALAYRDANHPGFAVVPAFIPNYQPVIVLT